MDAKGDSLADAAANSNTSDDDWRLFLQDFDASAPIWGWNLAAMVVGPTDEMDRAKLY